MQNQKIPITVIVTMLIQTIGVIWWLAKLDLRVHMHDKFVEQNQGLTEIVYRLEERVKNLTEEVNELEAIHKHK
ncbi:hypothetical protein NMD99_05780 [Wolbachia endosymbiont of Listronotus oregonensis]|uniref:hypothetical protein n=1 Tax=Wolbachia endosymbiont of Listronotus oregonensis TaxID=2969106 RepID=UPI0028166EEE|nr:hypothetical protein [Wolbachia endosymbiont of Listronotus oregonensis]WMT84132.1 hypothetical protein NMD99_05780 [Wolbachia endosymbiont of Listronotus oregonensis]